MTAIYAVEVLKQSFEKVYIDFLKHSHDFLAHHKQDTFLENYCIEKGYDPSLKETAKTIRNNFLQKLLDKSYGGNLPEFALELKKINYI